MSCQSFQAAEFLLKSQMITIWGFPCMLLAAFPLLLLIFSLWPLIFVSLINTCLGVFLLRFILYGTLCFQDLNICFPMLGKFLAISSNYFLRTFLFSFCDPFNVNFGALMSERSLKLFSFLFILFSLFCSAAVISTNTNLSSSSLNLLFCLIYSGTDSGECIFHSTYCTAQLCFVLFLVF